MEPPLGRSFFPVRHLSIVRTRVCQDISRTNGQRLLIDADFLSRTRARSTLAMQRKAFLLPWLLLTTSLQAQLCALDVFVANDQSGSVSAIENTQSRQFITALFNGMQPWGSGAGESRMAIADWDSPNVWQQFSFPSVGASYTTEMSDVLAYQNAPRALLGGTDPVTALTRAFQQIGQAPIAGRTAKPIIVLMTDADCSQADRIAKQYRNLVLKLEDASCVAQQAFTRSRGTGRAGGPVNQFVTDGQFKPRKLLADR